MKMKQFFHLTFVFLLLACIAHSAGAITDLEKRWSPMPDELVSSQIAMVYHR